jgi:hypothetical protein
VKEPPKEIDGCPVGLGAQLEICDKHGNETGRMSNWFLVFPDDEGDKRVWEWNQRTGEIRVLEEGE